MANRNAIANLHLDNAEEASKPGTRALVVSKERESQMDETVSCL